MMNSRKLAKRKRMAFILLVAALLVIPGCTPIGHGTGVSVRHSSTSI
ncbi:MAG: hypothetical protein LUC43_00300 [Burkholderiales bacterium]|nr:hypothetical protein [Burkholderiales bacterium]